MQTRQPLRIASLLASATEILYGLGLGDRLVAVSHECDYPPDAAGKPRVTRTLIDADAPSLEIDRQVTAMVQQNSALYEIDVPGLAALRPDLIVTQAQCDVCAVRYEDVVAAVGSAPELAGTRVVALNPMTLEGILADIHRVGEAAGCADAAQTYVDSLRSRISKVRKITQTLPQNRRPRVICIEWLDPIMLAGNWMPELIEIAGGSQGLTVAGRYSAMVPWAKIRAENPEVIIVSPCGFDLTRTVKESAFLSELPGWRELPAVRGRRVFAVDGNAYFNRSGPRIVDSLEILACLFHPDRFDPPETAGKEPPWTAI